MESTRYRDLVNLERWLVKRYELSSREAAEVSEYVQKHVCRWAAPRLDGEAAPPRKAGESAVVQFKRARA